MSDQILRMAGRVLALCWLAVPAVAGASPVTAVATTQTYQPHYEGFGRVESIRTVVLRSALAGRLTGFDVVPGQAVSRGQVLGHLAGPAVQAQQADAEAELKSARQVLSRAQDAERSAARTYPDFTNRRALDRLRSGVAEARARLAEARAALDRVQAQSAIVSPVDGTVSELEAAAGANITAGQVLAEVMPQQGLWLRAEFFGDAAQRLAPGLQGRFLPADGGVALKVKVAEVLPQQAPDGGRMVGLVAVSGAGSQWHAGEAGTVKLVGGAGRTMVAVPSGALILSRGQWWVLVDENGSLRKAAVEPGSVRGNQTLIRKGLAADTPVVVRDAYLLFHRDFARRYTPPD